MTFTSWCLTAVDPSTSQVADLAKYGLLGIILLLILMGYLWAKPSVERILADKEKAEMARDAMIEVYQAQVIPALRDATTAVAKAAELVEEAGPMLAEMRGYLEARRQ